LGTKLFAQTWTRTWRFFYTEKIDFLGELGKEFREKMSDEIKYNNNETSSLKTCDTSIAEFILKSGIQLLSGKKDPLFGEYVLGLACKEGKTDVVEFLISQGVNTRFGDDILLVLAEGHKDIVRLLEQNRA
jgi:hypothetical protein